jgi:LPS-assembly protein
MARTDPPRPCPRAPRGRALLAAVALALCAALLAPAAGAQPLPERAPIQLRQGAGEATVLADRIEQIGGPSSLVIATGNVEIAHGLTRLLADRVEINQDTGEAVAQGRVVFFDGQDRLVGDRIDYNLKTGTGVVHGGSAFAAPYYRLSGERMERVGESVYRVRRGTFTTCEGDNPDWSFRVGEATAEIDEIVYGRDASFWVRSIPLIPWVPYFAAAIKRERQSGFLMPQLGYSSRKGFELGVPYYWVISDSQDATITPYVISERGVGLAAEYRYILSTSQRGRLQGFTIPEFFRSEADREQDDVPLWRGAVTYQHAWLPTDRLSFKADVNYTSDDRIFRDYGNAITERSRDRAESNVFISHRWDAWNVVGNVLWYQDLTTPTEIELQRVPDIRVTGMRQPVPGTRGLPGLELLLMEAEGSFTSFLREVGPGGIRVDAHPRLSLPVPLGRWLTVTPFVGGRLTLYTERVVGFDTVDGFSVERTVDDVRLRSQVEWGVEAETRAARVFPLGGAGGLEAVRHVIEPRVTYLEIRGLNQKGNPQYEPQVDDIGKESRLAVSLTQRLYAKTVSGPNQEPIRWEAVRLTLAQPINLLDVGRRGRNPWDDFFGELIVQPNWLFSFRTTTRYNWEGIGFREATADVGIAWKDVIAAVGYRYDFDVDSNVITGGIGARVHTNLDVHVSTHYDLEAGRAVENRFGLDFRFQCFTIMVEYVNRPKDENEVRVAIGLLGIGQAGSKIGAGGSGSR